jgi:hypothetical protein
MNLAGGFGNYGPIIFAVIYIAYSIIKAGKKVTGNRPVIEKRPQSPPVVQPPVARPAKDSGGEIRKMLEDLMGVPSGQIAEKKAPAKPQRVPVQKASYVPRKEKQESYSMQPEEMAPAAEFVSHPEVLRKAFTENAQEEETGVDFDIRQAIIYSEILKRPEY